MLSCTVKYKNSRDLVVGVLLATPAGPKVLDGDAEVGGGGGAEVKQHLLRFVEQVASQTTFDLQHSLQAHACTQTLRHRPTVSVPVSWKICRTWKIFPTSILSQCN